MKRKIARLVMSAISCRDCDDPITQYHRLKGEIVDLGVGGYIVFGGNIDSTPEVIADLAEVSPHPLVVGSDLERGLGQQLEGGTVFPSQMALGATGVPDLAFAQGWVTGIEAKAVGINLVFAPVSDVMSQPANPIIGVRSYGEEPWAVADLGSAFIQGCQVWGVGATAKHFPGHGDTTLDSHIELPTVSATRATMEGRELLPFRSAIAAGVRAIMTAHVTYPALDAGVPATLSERIVGGILRGELGFDGLVVTDALVMGAIVSAFGPGEAAVRALEAGCDLLLVPSDVAAAIDGIYAAVVSGRLREGRIDESLARIAAFRAWSESCEEPETPGEGLLPEVCFLLSESAGEGCPARTEGSPKHNAVALEIARRAVTLLRDVDRLIPCERSMYAPERAAAFALAERSRVPNLVWLRSEINARIAGLDVDLADDGTSDDEIARMEAVARDKKCVMVAVFDEVAAWRGRTGPSDRLVTILERLARACPSVAVIAFAGPGIAARVPERCSLLCCYDGAPASQTAAIEALFGEKPIEGRLPVSVPPLFDLGFRLR